VSEGVWQQDGSNIEYRLDGVTYFRDSLDHWSNAIQRLLEIDDARARDWVEAVSQASKAKHGRPLSDVNLEDGVSTLVAGSAVQFPQVKLDVASFAGAVRGPECIAAADVLWSGAIGDDESLAMIGSSQDAHAWQVEATTLQPRDWGDDFYEEEYFQGDESRIGYTDYLAQQGWRLEKADRQVRQLTGLAGFLGLNLGPGSKVLDVGSGYGYFRQAAGKVGWQHEGVEISNHAARFAQGLFGFETSVGTLEQYAESAAGGFDMLTMWDTIEHVPDPLATLATAGSLMKPGGLMVLRTPNLLAVEREVFGRYYHSFKRDHVSIFSAKSISLCCIAAGLTPRIVQTDNHLLRGFLGNNLDTLAMTLRGSDLLAIAQRPLS
jgi:2-polyprenyl-3-methyl-5-hydroxy-6-metoxy-1,4-benzoquinol methylase